MSRSSDLQSFGLRCAPFSKEIDDGELWLPESKAALVADIEEALTERHSVLLLGEPGVGKTCVLRALRHRLPEVLLSGLSDGRLIRLRDAHQADGSSPCSAEGEAGGTPHVLPLRRRIGLGQS